MREQVRLRFGLKSLLAIVALAAVVALYIRQAPSLNENYGTVSWSFSQPSAVDESEPIECWGIILLRAHRHRWFGWRRDLLTKVEFVLGSCDGEAPSRKLVIKRETRLIRSPSGGQKHVEYPRWHLPRLAANGRKETIRWRPEWGDPFEVLDEFTADDSVVHWSAEAFEAWVIEKNRLGNASDSSQ